MLYMFLYLISPYYGLEGAKTRSKGMLVYYYNTNFSLIFVFIKNTYFLGVYGEPMLYTPSKGANLYFVLIISFGVAVSICQIYGSLCAYELVSHHFGGLAKENIDALPTSTLTPYWIDPEGSSICVICQNRLKPGDVVKSLPCNHQFHPKCIDEWLYRSATCPMCILGASRAVTQSSPVVAASVAIPSSSQVSIA